MWKVLSGVKETRKEAAPRGLEERMLEIGWRSGDGSGTEGLADKCREHRKEKNPLLLKGFLT